MASFLFCCFPVLALPSSAAKGGYLGYEGMSGRGDGLAGAYGAFAGDLETLRLWQCKNRR